MSAVIGWGLAAAGAMVWLVAAVRNWVWAARQLGAGGSAESPTLLAGPVGVLVVIQGLRMTGLVETGSAVLLVAIAGLMLDPGALPLLLTGAWRAARAAIRTDGSV